MGTMRWPVVVVRVEEVVWAVEDAAQGQEHDPDLGWRIR